jgi:hypothetical protein
MRPSTFQRLFTDNRPLYFIAATGALATCIWSCWLLYPLLTMSYWRVVEFVGLLLLATITGAALSLFPGALLISPLIFLIEHRNGAPFREGDEVIILSKRFRSRITRIYEVWSERHQVRVELGEAERKNVTDVFSYRDVCRTTRRG